MVEVLTTQALDRLEVTLGPKKLGQIFLDLGYLTHEKLDHALAYQLENGGRLGWILASQGYISRLEMYKGLARHLSLPFETNYEYLRQKIDKRQAVMLSHQEMLRYQAVPFYIEGKHLAVLTAEPNDPETMKILQEKFRTKTISQIIVTDLDIMNLSEELYRNSILDTSVNGLLHRNYEESAYTVFTGEQIAFAAGFICMLGALLYFDTSSTILAILFITQLFYAIPILFKLAVVIWGGMKRPSFSRSKANKPFNEFDLPVYTILVAAYKEKEVIGNLIKCIKKFDYPEDKLDIILLLEENDKETLEAAKAEKPPANWRFLVCPKSKPQTKPKALNYGLIFARGEFLTIYDAEDLPEPDQLKKAVAAFRTHPDNYICFQAALNYFNKNENFLTRMFTLEYSSWFDCLLPGLFRMDLPIPLGGTSNHFDVKKLRKIGAWDPYNVTEDADLGIRASVEGYKVGIIDSTTYEEANGQLKNWTRQRSRWVKGYLQTFLVHSRHPLKQIKALGFIRWLSYALLIGGTPATFLLSPVMWLLFGLSCFLDVSGLFYVPSGLIYLAGLNLIAGNAIVILIAMISAIPRKNWGLIPLAILSPVYWMLQSCAAYKGLWQLFTKPFYWEKTNHGITRDIPVSRTLEIPKNVPEMVVIRDKCKK
jgi:glycosyltransferase XagB